MQDYPIQPIPFTQAQIADLFWSPRLKVNRNTTIPYNFQKCEDTGRVDNFLKAAKKMEGPHTGLVFNDSDVFKVMEFMFVFIVPLFGLKYFIHRAPDFFDWRSGVFELNQEKFSVTIDIKSDLHEQLKIRANVEGEPISAIAKQAVALYLAQLEVEDE